MTDLIHHIWQELRAIVGLGAEVFASMRGPLDGRAILRQAYEVGNRSVFFVLLTLAFLGAILNLQAGFQALRVLGDASMIGEQLLPLLIRQLVPTLTGLMVATRVGTGMAAELGSMVVTEQVDALKMCNAPPVPFLVKPRFLATLIMGPALTAFGLAAAFFAGLVTATLVFGTNPQTYATFDKVSGLDVVEGLLKAQVYGAVIPIIACAAGLSARGGSEGVGEATTRAVVETCLAVIVLDFVLGGVVFLFR